MLFLGVPVWILSGTLLLTMTIGWLGFHGVGRRSCEKHGYRELGRVEDAIGILLALILAFALTSAEGKFETREEQGVTEAIAIGTCFQRCELLPPALIEVCRAHLRRYVDLHVEVYHNSTDLPTVQRLLDGTEQIHVELWKVAVQAIRQTPPTAIHSLIIDALNEMVDAHETRVMNRLHRVPDVVLGMTLAVCIVWACTSGYSYGLRRYQPLIAWIGFAFLAVLIVHLTLDLNREYGLIQPVRSRGAMLDLSRMVHGELDGREPAPGPPR